MLVLDRGSRMLLPAVLLQHKPKLASTERVRMPSSSYLIMETFGQVGYAKIPPMLYGSLLS